MKHLWKGLLLELLAKLKLFYTMISPFLMINGLLYLNVTELNLLFFKMPKYFVNVDLHVIGL